MVKTIFIAVLAILGTSKVAHSQHTYEMNYWQFNGVKELSTFPLLGKTSKYFSENKVERTLLFNDTMAVDYFNSYGMRIYNLQVSDKRKVEFHHSVLMHLPSSEVYAGSAYRTKPSLMRYKRFVNFTIDTSKVYEFLGYQCYVATSEYNGNFKKALITKEIDLPFGPILYYRFPALCLQLYDSESKSLFIANKISRTNEMLEFPFHLPVIEYRP